MNADAAVLHRTDLRAVFAKDERAAERVGLEIESAVVDPGTGKAAPYDSGVRGVLAAVAEEFGGTREFDGEHLTGVRADSGMLITLEHGGALEYASAPAEDLVTAVEELRETMGRVAEIARGRGLAILPGAVLPFNSVADVPWVPKPRGALMRSHFAALGAEGAGGAPVMALTLSTQATLDYVSEADLAEKLRLAVAASPVAAALFANSPLENGRPTGLQSGRCRHWLSTDPARCGVVVPALRPDMGVDDFVDWALTLPMIFRKTPSGEYAPAPARPFGELLEHGFGDGTHPGGEDWYSLLCQIWTDVRVRQTLEMRAPDGPAYADVAAVPAFWVGLLYSATARAAAGELLAGLTAEDVAAASRQVPERGLDATLAGTPVLELGRELVRLAGVGLRERVEAGLESPAAPGYLAPVEEVAATGVSFADQVARRWETEFGRDPARYVAAYRVP
ncbi:glutamate-cysteine ligase family protein [Actinokineospora sp. 24-640]